MGLRLHRALIDVNSSATSNGHLQKVHRLQLIEAHSLTAH